VPPSTVDPVRWGFIGAGGIATVALAPAVRAADNAVLEAAAARNPARAAALGPRGQVYARYDDVLADDDVEIVYVSLANDAHKEWTIRAADAGKAVLTEKPLGLDASEVDEMASAAERNGVLVVEAFWYRWHPRIRLAHRMVTDGRLGRILDVSAGFTFDDPLTGNYRLEPAKGGGALYDVGCYATSAVLWAVGALPEAVIAHQQRGVSGVDLETTAELRWANGTTADITAGIRSDRGQWLRITGERGTIELPGESFSTLDGVPTTLVLTTDGVTERIAIPAANAYRVMVEEFSAVVRGEPGWVHSLRESQAIAGVLDACFESGDADGETIQVSAMDTRD
jgi:xylose dehydrogenase (NAD/NADP)